jgi:CRP-like cAMP-binding protein
MEAGDPIFAEFATALRWAVAPLQPAPGALDALAAASDLRALKKGEHLLRMGDVAGHLFFVGNGLLRYYHLDPATGTERTGQFFDHGQVVTDVESFLSGRPAKTSFQAIAPSQVLRLPRVAVLAAYDADHAIERYGRLMVQDALAGSQRRAERLLTLSPEEMYRTFVATRPEVARRVPQYLIASYLGITPEALSRIRGRAAGRPPREGAQAADPGPRHQPRVAASALSHPVAGVPKTRS